MDKGKSLISPESREAARTSVESVNLLRGVIVYDYFHQRGMRPGIEAAVEQMVDALLAAPGVLVQDDNLAAAGPELAWIFAWFGRKRAGQSVREGSISELRRAMVAAALALQYGDARDCLPLLAMLVRSSEKLGLDPKKALLEVARCGDAKGRKEMEWFIERPLQLQELQAFGFSEGTGPMGFDYVPLLAEFGGPTPLDH